MRDWAPIRNQNNLFGLLSTNIVYIDYVSNQNIKLSNMTISQFGCPPHYVAS